MPGVQCAEHGCGPGRNNCGMRGGTRRAQRRNAQTICHGAIAGVASAARMVDGGFAGGESTRKNIAQRNAKGLSGTARWCELGLRFPTECEFALHNSLSIDESFGLGLHEVSQPPCDYSLKLDRLAGISSPQDFYISQRR